MEYFAITVANKLIEEDHQLGPCLSVVEDEIE